MLTQFNIKDLIQENFLSIPKEILEQKRLCLWEYRKSKTSSKKLKIPYGIDIFNFVYPSLKDSSAWFDYHKTITLNEEDKKIYGLGIVLNDGPYICIDIDNCIEIDNSIVNTSNKVCQIIQKFSKAYCEISPSQKGLHIIFKGTWECNREKSLTKLDDKLKIEVYSGNSCRFVTLTGNRIIYKNNQIQLTNDPLISIGSYPFNSESVQFIYKDFFTNSKYNNKHKENKTFKDLSKYTQNIVGIINSNEKSKNTYYNLCNNKIAQSDSEDDYRFCLFILNHIQAEYEDNIIINLLVYFLQNGRLYRDKLERIDYTKRTAMNAILYSRTNNLMGSAIINQSFKKLPIFISKQLLKICNQMTIFYINNKHQEQNKVFIFKTNDTNFVEFHTPIILDSFDLDYLIEILYQFSNKHLYLADDENTWETYRFSCEINIPLIAKRLKKADCGSFRSSLIKSLKKLSLVKIFYKKQIVKNGKIHEGSVDLLNYKSMETLSVNSKSKIIIELNFLTFSILKKASYNYTLLNTEHRNTLPDSQLRLLYNYFCTRTIPGAKFKTQISFTEILNDLWSHTSNQSTLRSRKKRLFNLLEKLKSYSDELSDFIIEYPKLTEMKKSNNNVFIRIKRLKASLEHGES